MPTEIVAHLDALGVIDPEVRAFVYDQVSSFGVVAATMLAPGHGKTAPSTEQRSDDPPHRLRTA